MDSFELLSQFSGLLSSLNSSKQASIEICNFLIRNYVAQEDLYPTILRVLPTMDINRRVNILQFLDDFVTMIMKEKKHKDNDIIFNYVFLILSDLHKILQYVLPDHPDLEALRETNQESNYNNINIRVMTNLPLCFKILQHLSQLFQFEDLHTYETEYNNNLLTEEDKIKIKEGLMFDTSALYVEIEATKSNHVDDYLNSSQQTQDNVTEENYIPHKINEGLNHAWKFIIQKRKQSQYESLMIDLIDDPFHLKKVDIPEEPVQGTSPPKVESVKNTPFKTPSKTPAAFNIIPSSQPTSSDGSKPTKPAHVLALTHSLILQRIEADRERQKRGKETLWEVERKSGKVDMSEFEYVYNTTQTNDVLEDKLVVEELESLYELCTMNQLKPTNPQPKDQTKTNPNSKPNSNPNANRPNTNPNAPPRGSTNQRGRGNKNRQNPPHIKNNNNNKNNVRPYDKDDLFYDRQPAKRPHYEEYYNEQDWYANNNRGNNYRNNQQKRPRK